MSSAAAVSFSVRDAEYFETAIPTRSLRLRALLEIYCQTRPALGDKARAQYVNAVNLARRWLLAVKTLHTDCDALFSLPVFCDWARWLSEGGRSPATTNGRVDVLWMLWCYASDEGLCASPLPPKRKKPRWKEQKRDPVAFTIDEIIRLLAAAMVAPPMERCTWWTSDHWVTLIGAFLATAERFEALADCPRSALQGNVLTVPAHLTKDGKENPVVLPDWIAEKIRGLPAIGGDPRVWPYPFELRTLRERYTLDILKPAALPHSRHHKFHALRRSAVTQVKIIHGLEAAREMARHFGEGLTLKSYVSRRVERSQNGSVSFEVPKPEAPDRQQRLF